MNDLKFLEERSNQIKEEIKGRKNWKKALIHEYGLVRSFKEGTRPRLIEMIKVADIMIRHYENILKEHEEMIKELKGMK